jgi:hypothetical protein
MSFPLTNILLLRAKALIVSNDDVLSYFDNRTTQSANITGSSEYLTGIYQEPDTGTYSGSIHDLTEQQITDISNGDAFGAIAWSTLEKAWVLENLDTTSSSGVKRYDFTFSSYDSGVLNIPVLNSGARGNWGSLEQAIFDGDELPPEFVPGSQPILQGSSVITDWIGAGADGVLDFDGVDDYVNYALIIDITGDKQVEFDYYTTSTTGGVRGIIYVRSNGNDMLYIYQEGQYIKVQSLGNSATGGKQVDVSSYLNQIINVRVVKTTGAITDIFINDVSLAVPLTGGYVRTNDGFTIGRSIISDYLFDAYVMNVRIGDFNAPGHPNGNQSSAWSNGSYTATVNGSPTTTNIGNGVANNWTLNNFTNVSPEVITGDGFFKKAQRLTKNNNNVGTSFKSDNLAVTIGEEYIISLRYYQPALLSSNTLKLRAYNSSNQILVELNLGDYAATTEAVVAQSGSFVADDSTIYLLFLVGGSLTNGEEYNFDEIELIQI